MAILESLGIQAKVNFGEKNVYTIVSIVETMVISLSLGSGVSLSSVAWIKPENKQYLD